SGRPRGKPRVFASRLGKSDPGPPGVRPGCSQRPLCLISARTQKSSEGGPKMGKRPVTVRMARWSAEHPWRAIALWVVFVAVCFVGGTMAGTNKATAQDDAIGESGQAYVMIEHGKFAD